MGEWTAGLAAFGLYFLYDWNRVYRKNGWMKPFFAAGSLLLGLVLLVAIPLPGTGAWTGALIAAFLNIRLRHALPAITLGLLIAGSLVTLMTLGLIHLL